MEAPKLVGVRLPGELHKRIKVFCAQRNIFVQDFYVEALKEKLRKELLRETLDDRAA